MDKIENLIGLNNDIENKEVGLLDGKNRDNGINVDDEMKDDEDDEDKDKYSDDDGSDENDDDGNDYDNQIWESDGKSENDGVDNDKVID